MSSRPSRRRSSGRMYENLTPAPNQQYFTPKTRSVRSGLSTSSTTRKRQQTITQMDPFHAIYHPHEGDDLAYEEAVSDAQEELPPKKKRRKTMPLQREDTLTQSGYVSRGLQVQEELDGLKEMDNIHVPGASSRRHKRRQTTPDAPTRTVQTRSAVRQAVQSKIKGEEDVVKSAQSSVVEKSEDNQADIAAALMLPPKTPKSSRRKEIPSSQSPADTPLSSQSRRSCREKSRSPLKEKSTNIPKGFHSPKKNVRQIPKLVVADTMDSTSSTEESISTQAEFKNELRTIYFGGIVTSAVTSKGGFIVRDHVSSSVLPDSVDRIVHSSRKQAEIARSEVFDSDGGDSDESLAASGLDVGFIPKPAEATMTLGDFAEPIEHPVNQFGDQESHDNQNSSEDAAVPLATYSDDAAEVPKEDFVHQPRALDESGPHGHQCIRSESEEASAQLTAEFIRITQPSPLVETDSQWEATWRPYSGSEDPRDYYQPNNEDSSSPALNKLPALITTPFSRSQTLPMSSPIRLPPSQATTVDITQPLTQLRSSSARRPSHSLPTLSSPPPLPPILSSSPFRTRKDGEAYMGYVGGWNGERLTDSQLLPESLMDDSMPGPPLSLLVEEGWEGEDSKEN
jgi:hypothetical protein